MFWNLIDPNVKYFFIPFINGSPVHEVSFLFWILLLLGILISIAVHEFAHAFVAYKLGDDTPLLEGRITLNPFKHMDVFGLILIFLFFFSYGKPVNINPYKLANPQKHLVYIAFSGPVSNLILSAVVGIIFFFLKDTFRYTGEFNSLQSSLLGLISTMIHALPYVGYINLMLFLFNLLPFIPLDGSKVIYFFNYKVSSFFEKYVFPYSIIFILMFIFPITGNLSLLTLIARPFINAYLLIIGYGN